MRRQSLGVEKLFGDVRVGTQLFTAPDGARHVEVDVFERGGAHHRASATVNGDDLPSARARALADAWLLCAQHRPDLAAALEASPALEAEFSRTAPEWN